MAFALKSLDRVLAEAWDADAGLAHVVAYGEGVAQRTRVAGVLEDYVFLGDAALDAWEATGELRYYDAAQGDCGCDDGAVLRCGGAWVFRYGAGRGAASCDWGAECAAEAAAGFADAGGESGGGDAAAAAGGAERASRTIG